MDGLAVPDEIGSVFSLCTKKLLAPLSGDGTVVEGQIHVFHHITPVQSPQPPQELLTQSSSVEAQGEKHCKLEAKNIINCSKYNPQNGGRSITDTEWYSLLQRLEQCGCVLQCHLSGRKCVCTCTCMCVCGVSVHVSVCVCVHAHISNMQTLITETFSYKSSFHRGSHPSVWSLFCLFCFVF